MVHCIPNSRGNATIDTLKHNTACNNVGDVHTRGLSPHRVHHHIRNRQVPLLSNCHSRSREASRCSCNSTQHGKLDKTSKPLHHQFNARPLP